MNIRLNAAEFRVLFVADREAYLPRTELNSQINGPQSYLGILIFANFK